MSKPFYFLLLLFFLWANSLQAQEPCGTVMPESTLEWIRSHRFYENPVADRTIYRVPIQFHIVGTDSGAGYYPANEVFRMLCQLNEDFEPVGFQFYVNTAFNYINNTSYYDHDYDAGYDMMFEHNVPNRVNVYIVESPAGNCGYFAGWPDAVAVAKSCSGNGSTTLTHELGHFFSLPHTFSGWEGAYDSNNNLTDEPPNNQQERVNGSNCANAGDGFCDTPPDYISYRWQCPLSFFLTDPLGVQFKPDANYYMSYSSDVCQSQFSEEQISAMRTYLTEQHNDLVGNPTNFDDTELQETEIFYPAPNSTALNNNQVLFAWKDVGADRYFVEITQYGSPTGTNISTFVEDTSYIANLDANLTYYAYIRPLNSGNTCTPASGVVFETGAGTGIYINNISAQMPLCYGDTNASVSITAAGGQAPYTYVWENGTVANQLSNVAAGTYHVNITDNAGNSKALSVYIPQPSLINATHTQTANFQATITANGGTPNYTYSWSNGENTDSPTNLIVGTNTVTVTDANGCTLEKNFTILGVQENLTPIYCTGDKGSIGFALTGGTEPYEYEWSNDDNTNTISNLEAGSYTVTITDQSNAKAVLTYALTEPTPITANISVNQNTATANVSGGTPPYSYYWPTGLTTSNFATDLPPFTYEVIIYDNDNCQKSVSFTITTQVGIDKPTANATVYVAPTVVQRGNDITIVAPQQNIVQMQVYGMDGKVVETIIPTATTWNTQNLVAGTYIIGILTDKSYYTQRLVVM